jgi:hypothetical protein
MGLLGMNLSFLQEYTGAFSDKDEVKDYYKNLDEIRSSLNRIPLKTPVGSISLFR